MQVRNAASGDEICDCIQKLLEVKALLRRDAKANKTVTVHRIPNVTAEI